MSIDEHDDFKKERFCIDCQDHASHELDLNEWICHMHLRDYCEHLEIDKDYQCKTCDLDCTTIMLAMPESPRKERLNSHQIP